MLGFGDKFIKGHWDTMDEKSRQIYLEHRTIQNVVRIICLSIVAIIVGGIALEPSCERADMERFEKEKSVQMQPTYQIRSAYGECIDKCFRSSATEMERYCAQQCGVSVRMVFHEHESLEDVDLKGLFDSTKVEAP